MKKLNIFWLAALALSLSPGFIWGAETVTSDSTVTTELWRGKVLTATFRAGICYHPDGSAKGVLLLRHANGNEDVYHLYGTMRDGEFALSHSSGHHFTGKLTGPSGMKGKVKLNRGISLSLEGERVKNAPLAASDCAPLP